jgi:hypothetical protein
VKYLDNVVPRRIDNFFSQEEIDQTYGYRKQLEEPYVSEHTGYFSSFIFYPENIQKKMYEFVDKYAEEEGVEFKSTSLQTHIGRYTLDTGFKPKLTPHTDYGLEFHSITISVLLKKNIEWPIGVNLDSWILNPGDAVIFSGTDQVHWRPKFDFKKGDFVESLIIQVVDERQKKSKDDQVGQQKKLLNFYDQLFTNGRLSV